MVALTVLLFLTQYVGMSSFLVYSHFTLYRVSPDSFFNCNNISHTLPTTSPTPIPLSFLLPHLLLAFMNCNICDFLHIYKNLKSTNKRKHLMMMFLSLFYFWLM